VRALGLRRGERILDVPCGFGRHARMLAARGMEVVGVDLSAAMLAEARRGRRSARPRFERGDMRRLACRDEFDAVICMFTSFGYFGDRENRGVLRRMARVLKSGGRVLIDHRDPIFDAKVLPHRDFYEPRPGLFILDDARSTRAPASRKRRGRSSTSRAAG
jgi:ubiquinone/menaquinone biosynthesis C-methylase UbiE